MKCKKIKRTTKVKIEEKPVQEESAKEEVISLIKEDKFVFAADMMGKTEQDLKNDTYKSYIRTFMNNIGKTFSLNTVSPAKIESAICMAERFNGAGILLSPIYFDALKRIKSKMGSLIAPIFTMAGMPYGLSTIDGLKKDISYSIESGATRIMAVLPTASIELGNLVAVKKEYVKLAKKYKKYPFGIAINLDFPLEQLKIFLGEVKHGKISSVTLFADDLEIEALGNYVTALSGIINDKKLIVTCSLDKFEDISYLFKCGVDKVYTTHFEGLCDELIQKFGALM